MKKEYIRPEMLVEEFISEIYMLGGSSDSEDKTHVGGENPGGDPGANDRRGSWGNLWD